MHRKAVITGIGIINSCSEGIENFRESLKEGRSGIGDIESLDVSQYPSNKAGEVKSLSRLKYRDESGINRYGRASAFGIAAAQMAMEDAAIDLEYYDPLRTGVVLGSILADVQFFELANMRPDNEVLFDQIPHYHPALNLSACLGCRGTNLTLSAACASGNYALGYGLDLIKTGQADCVLCGGTDALSHITFAGFNRLRIMTPDKCRPFDKERNGMILGEGACIFVVEEEKAAIKRGSSIYCEIAGYGLTCDAFDLSAPRMDGRNVVHAMEMALADSGLIARDIGHINAHGTGTNANDKVEALAYRLLFGNAAENIPVTSIKPMIGHTMGAAGAMEAAACAIALKFGIIPPILNYENEDPECNLNIIKDHSIINKDLHAVMNNSFGFGGANASIIFSQYE